MSTHERTAEVVVIGAGFAGLAGAQVLGRAQREVLVLGAGPTRNAEAEHAHNILTRDGTPPGELLRLGRAEVEALPTVRVEEARVTAVEHDGGANQPRLRVRLETGGVVRAPAVLLATGARDTLPEVDGLTALWGRRAHSCPFCDGEAYAGRRLLILDEEGPGAMKRALLGGWTPHLRVADPADVARLDLVADEVVATLRDGGRLVADGVFVGAAPVPGLAPVEGLPLARRGPFIAVDGAGRTSVPGLWAAGDCSWRDGDAGPGGQVVAAMAAASRAAASIIASRLGIEMPAPPPVQQPTAVS